MSLNDETYRIFISRTLQLLPQGQQLANEYRGIFYQKEMVDNRSGDEIAADVMASAGLKFG